ncbi:hypothetical protein [Shimwellia blattae]|uniref:hypothetical protein n=1 Tax=Shimwellia blattae TaxID=563 RepID=UPI000290E93F|nr:hypothetical protein [Shimwellia blattae]GAB81730.1 hypothetical protein EB105725_16_00600 [Shimwellia blattae DSM 4481 = NBRC 105725]
MTPQERKKQHQQAYEQQIAAIKSGQKQGTVVTEAPRAIKQHKHAVVASIF